MNLYAGGVPISRQGRTVLAVRLLKRESRGSVRLDSQSMVHGVLELLFASEVPLRPLHGDMPLEKLDLLKFSAGSGELCGLASASRSGIEPHGIIARPLRGRRALNW